MFTLLSTISRTARPCIWSQAIRPFSCIDRLRQALVQTSEEKAAHLERQRLNANAQNRQRYANDPVFRQKSRDSKKKWRRSPDNRDELKAFVHAHREKNREKYNARSAHHWETNLELRRSSTLSVLLNKGVNDTHTWKTHTPIRYSDRVDHHCTGCNRDRFLMAWWKEKLETPELWDQDRYMCNRCFANDWPRVVPETYTGYLANIFRSPELPLSKAQKEELAKEKGTESDKP
jgi:hypothetical protein